MALSKEMRDNLREFFQSTEGQVLLQRVGELREAHNDLRAVVNSLEGVQNPELGLARAAGRVDGIEKVLGLIEHIQEEG